MPLEKTIYMSQLFSIYKPLLTKKQREIFALYYDEDYSLSEIAENYGISRQAVHDNLGRGEKALINYEQDLNLYQKRQERIILLKQLKTSLETTESQRLVDQILDLE